MAHLKENNKLLQRENTELKAEISRLKEESKDKEEKWRSFIIAAEDQRANLELETKEKVQQLESELSMTKSKLSKTLKNVRIPSHYKSSHSSEGSYGMITPFSQTLPPSREFKEEHDDRANKFQEQAEKLGKDLIKAHTEISRLKGLLLTKNQDLINKEINNDALKKFNERIEALMEENKWLEDRLREKESIGDNEQIVDLLKRNEELNEMVNALSERVNSLQSERNELMKQLNRGKFSAGQKLSSSQGDFGKLTSEASDLLRYNASLKAESQILREQIKKLKEEEEFSEDSPEAVLELQKKVTELKLELSQLESQKINVQYELEYLTQEENKAIKEDESTRLRQENEYLKNSLYNLSAKAEEMGKKLREYYVEVTGTQRTINKLDQDCSFLKIKLQERGAELEQVRTEKADLELMLSLREEELNKTNNLGIEIKQLEAEAKAGKEAIAFINERLPSFNIELQQLRDKAKSLEIENKELKAISGNIRTESYSSELPESDTNMNKTLKKIDELEDELRRREREAIALRKRVNQHEFTSTYKRTGSEEIEKLKREQQVSSNKEAKLTRQVEQLKLLVIDMEAANNDLVKHINKEQPEEQTLDVLKKDLIEKSNELSITKIKKDRILKELEEVKIELGVKAAECENYKNQLNNALIDLNNAYFQLNQQIENTADVRIREGEQELQEQLLERTKELQDLKELLYYKTKEDEEILMDNQRLNTELDRLEISQNELKQITEQLQVKYEEAYQSLEQIKLERDDLAQSYKFVCDSNERYCMDMEVLNNENKSLKEKLEELQKALAAQDVVLHEYQKNQDHHKVIYTVIYRNSQK